MGTRSVAGMPLSSNGACALSLVAVGMDAMIITLAVAEAAVMQGGLAIYIASSTASIMGVTMTAEMLTAATVQAGAILLELGGLIALVSHLVELVNGHADFATIASVAADAAAKLGLFSHSAAAGFGVFTLVLGFLSSCLNDVLVAISNCSGPGYPPPGNGNPSYTTVGCNQSGGFGANFNASLAWGACRSVISN